MTGAAFLLVSTGVVIVADFKKETMTRQMTITLHGQHYLYDVEFERQEKATTYKIRPNKHFKGAIPEGFELTRSDNSDKPVYNEEGLSPEGKEIADAICAQISLLPMQFAGGKGEGKI